MRSAVSNKYQFLTDKGIEMNPVSHIVGRKLRKDKQNNYDFILVEKKIDEKQKEFLFEFSNDTSNLRIISTPAEIDSIKTVARYIRDEKYVIANLILANTYNHDYVENGVELTQGRVNDHGENFSSYKINSRKL